MLVKQKGLKFSPKDVKHAMTTLRRARKLLSNPKRWTKGRFFALKDGRDWYEAKNAQMFCALGAVMKADGPGEEVAKKFLAAGVSDLYYKRRDLNASRVYTFNDKKTTKHEDILAAFDKALEIAQAEAEANK